MTKTLPSPRLGARRWLRIAILALAIAIIVAGGAALWFWSEMRASLPRLEGQVSVAGLSAPVVIERDGLGTPTIHALSRIDLARATGFLHGQERFFQMDLARRRAAGKLSALLGAAALDADRQARRHRFTDLARRILAEASREERAVVRAYSEGVAAGLADLGARPVEYLLLRVEPEPWRPEDTVLTVISMFQLLQLEGEREATLEVLHNSLPAPLAEFLDPPGTEWDAPLVGRPLPGPPSPGPEVIDLRREQEQNAEDAARSTRADPPLAAGSNSWAVSGRLTAHGGAILANDMHLPLAVPNIWYRARFLIEAEGAGEADLDLTGVTLPGTPAMVVGSNTHVAWGLTNSQGDWSDLVTLEVNPADEGQYLTPDGYRPFETFTETIEIKGAESQPFEYRWTIWGPVVARDEEGRPLALRWVAHEPDAVNLGLMKIEQARTLDEAFAAAQAAGVPAQNFVAVDREGKIGWTIMGRIPRRLGFDGHLPQTWCDGERRWEGWLSPEEYPQVRDPGRDRIWTANNRLVEGAELALLGDGGYAPGARARQIRDALMGNERFDEKQMLEIQRDDRALFLQRWQSLLLEVLDDQACAASEGRKELRRRVKRWAAAARVESVGYRLVRGFRRLVFARVLPPLVAPASRRARCSPSAGWDRVRGRCGGWSARGRRTFWTRPTRAGRS